jgi:hypothetical protein
MARRRHGRRGGCKSRRCGGAAQLRNSRDTVWKKIKGAVSDAHDFVKDNRIISSGLGAMGNPFGLGTMAHVAGYGRRRRHHRRGGAGYVKF